VTRGCLLTAALVLAGGAGSQVAAQQVEVRVVVPQATVKEIRAAIERTLDQAIDPKLWAEISRELSEAIRESLAGAHDAAREVAEALRESAHGMSSHTWGSHPGARQDRTYTQEQIAKESHSLAIGAAGTLVLRNVAGDITVTAGNGRSATVDVVRRSRGRTDANAKLGLERVKVEVDHRGEQATVTARYPENERRPPYAVSVTYTVTAPAGTRVTVSTISGNVQVRDIKGEVIANVTSGDVTVAGSRVSSLKTLSGTMIVTDSDAVDGALELSTLNGDITLERAKARRVSITALNGDIVARDIDAGAASISSTSGDVTFSGSLAKGGRYELRAHSGDVRVTLPKGGFALTARTFSGRITADTALSLSAMESARTYMRGTVGDGGATLDVATFSGDVTISRK